MASTTTRPGVAVWLEAARPRTLPAAVTPVLVGTAASVRAPGDIGYGRFAGALVVALALQVAVNYANDYFDARGGVDTAERVGPRRAVGGGLVSPSAMRTAMLAAFGVAGLAGLALAAVVGWELLLVGLAAIVAAVAYSGGPRPYASAGLGEVFVFVFFGLVATVGSQYVQDTRIELVAVLAALPVGALVTAILVVNNLRDISTDRDAGKRTLAVRLGQDRTRVLYHGLVWGGLALVAPLVLLTGSPAPALATLAVLFAGRATGYVQLAGRALSAVDPPEDPDMRPGPLLVKALETTGRLHLAFGVLLAAGLALAR